jgi:hypothetical protein
MHGICHCGRTYEQHDGGNNCLFRQQPIPPHIREDCIREAGAAFWRRRAPEWERKAHKGHVASRRRLDWYYKNYAVVSGEEPEEEKELTPPQQNPSDTFATIRDAISKLERGDKQARALLDFFDFSSQGHLPEKFWEPDRNSRVCRRCDKPFTGWRRRHHCRVCGRLVCGDCYKSHDLGKFFSSKVCRTCISLLPQTPQ